MKCLLCGNEFKPVKKKVDGVEFDQVVCKECIKEKFSIEKTHFNVMCESTKFAFNIPEDVYNSSRSKYAITLENLIKKYGEEEGYRRWLDYCQKQSYSNTFEYKKEKYGWTEEDFKEYNKSRSITLENLIKKYGEEEGNRRWLDYCQKQSITKSFDYMVEKFGYEKARNINLSKSNSLQNFIKRYGEEEGTQRYYEFYNKSKDYFSKISQEAFSKLDNILSDRYTTYYATKNKEYGVMLSTGYIKLDYFIKELNLCIEFNGTVFHADPRRYKENDHPNPFNKLITAKDIWEKEKSRIELLKKEKGIETIILWEDDYLDNFDPKIYILNILEKYKNE